MCISLYVNFLLIKKGGKLKISGFLIFALQEFFFFFLKMELDGEHLVSTLG